MAATTTNNPFPILTSKGNRFPSWTEEQLGTVPGPTREKIKRMAITALYDTYAASPYRSVSAFATDFMGLTGTGLTRLHGWFAGRTQPGAANLSRILGFLNGDLSAPWPVRPSQSPSRLGRTNKVSAKGKTRKKATRRKRAKKVAKRVEGVTDAAIEGARDQVVTDMLTRMIPHLSPSGRQAVLDHTLKQLNGGS